MPLGLPFLPEVVWLLGFTKAKQIIHFDIEGICPPCMISTPSDESVKPRIGFVIGARSDTIGTRFTNTCPIDTTFLSIYRPLECAGSVGYVIGFDSSFPKDDGLGRTHPGTFLTNTAELCYPKLYWRIGYQR